MGDKVLCEKSDLLTIADAVRDATGLTDHFNVPDLAEKACEALAGSGGIDTSDATASQEHIVDGKTAYVNGTKITGTNPYEKTTTDAQVAEIEGLIEELNASLDGKSGSGATVKTCTVMIKKETSGGSVYLHQYTTYNGAFSFHHSGTTGAVTEYIIDELSYSSFFPEIDTYIIENVVIGSILDLYIGGDIPLWTASGEYEVLTSSDHNDCRLGILGDVIVTFRDDD